MTRINLRNKNIDPVEELEEELQNIMQYYYSDIDKFMESYKRYEQLLKEIELLELRKQYKDKLAIGISELKKNNRQDKTM